MPRSRRQQHHLWRKTPGPYRFCTRPAANGCFISFKPHRVMTSGPLLAATGRQYKLASPAHARTRSFCLTVPGVKMPLNLFRLFKAKLAANVYGSTESINYPQALR